MAHIPDLQQTRHIGTAALSGPITAGWSVKITSSGLISRLAAMYRPIVSDLPKIIVFELSLNACIHMLNIYLKFLLISVGLFTKLFPQKYKNHRNFLTDIFLPSFLQKQHFILTNFIENIPMVCSCGLPGIIQHHV